MGSTTRLAFALPFAVAACGLVSGLDDLHVGDAGAGGDAGVSDASLDVGSCGAGSCGAPAGFQPVLFATDRATSCTGSTDVVVDPAVQGDGACTCSCKSTGACLPQPSLPLTIGSLSCTQSDIIPVVLDGGCNAYNSSNPPSRASVGPFPVIGEACTNALNVSGKISGSEGRLCPLASCASCQAPAGFQLCFVSSSTASCPPGTTAHTVAQSAQLACSPCTACSSTASCGGTLHVYDDGTCGYQTDAISVNGTCNVVQNDVLGAFKYEAVLNPGTCTAGTSTASLSLTAQGIVCCP